MVITLDEMAQEEANYATSSEAKESWGLVHIGGRPIPIKGGVGVTNLGTLQSRITFGDYSLSSDPFMSVWVQSSWSGGGQVEELSEQSHGERFRTATADTRYPRMLTQPLETLSFDIGTMATTATPIGDYEVGGTVLFWAAFDDELRYWDKDTQEFTGGDTLTTAPAGAMKGVVYDDLLWIPQGAGGYDTWDGAAVVHSNAVTPIQFVEWDDKLLCLEHDGQVSTWDGVTWSSPTALKLRGRQTPRHLVVWWSQEGFPTVYIVTDATVWAVDPLVPTMYRTGLTFPVHPDQGRGAASWRDDALYVSVGVGVHQLTRGNVITAMGLDRDDGLPSDLRGVIVDMEPEYNGMLALVQGVGTVVVGDDEATGPTVEETLIYGDALMVPSAASYARSTLQRFTGTGWHTVWESDGADGIPTTVLVSQADDEYALWWGYAGRMYRQPLRRTFYHPRQGVQLGIDRFEVASALKTGRFDGNLATYRKLASHVEFRLDPLSTGEVEVWYETDRTGSQQLLGTVSGTGQQRLMFDPDGDGFSEGMAFTWIEFEYRLRNSVATESVIINWIALYFLVLPLQTTSWRLNVPLRIDEQWIGDGPREIADALDALTTAEAFTTFKHRDRVFRVFVAQTSGAEAVGEDLRGDRSASILAINPQPVTT